jgi:hypothetical protein
MQPEQQLQREGMMLGGRPKGIYKAYCFAETCGVQVVLGNSVAQEQQPWILDKIQSSGILGNRKWIPQALLAFLSCAISSPGTLHNNDSLLSRLAHVRVEALYVLIAKEQLGLAEQYITLASVAAFSAMLAQ